MGIPKTKIPDLGPADLPCKTQSVGPESRSLEMGPSRCKPVAVARRNKARVSSAGVPRWIGTLDRSWWSPRNPKLGEQDFRRHHRLGNKVETSQQIRSLQDKTAQAPKTLVYNKQWPATRPKDQRTGLGASLLKLFRPCRPVAFNFVLGGVRDDFRVNR